MTDLNDKSSAKEYTLERDCELRFEIESKIQVEIQVCWFVYVFERHEIYFLTSS